MGIFDVFKKQKKTSQVAFHETIATNFHYDPWEQQALPRNENYATAAIIRLCQTGATLGKTADDYPRYLNYQFKIHNPVQYHKRLIDMGYLDVASSEVALQKLKLPELKAILEKHNLTIKGKKTELIQRICENINPAELYLPLLYIPSQKGIEHLARYSFIFEVIKYDITTDQYDVFAKKYPQNTSPHDIVWRMLNDRFNKNNMSNKYGLARNDLYNMALFLINENKFTDALYHLILVLYYDTSGLSNSGYVEIVESVPPGIVDLLHKYKDYFTDEMVFRCYERYRLPHHHLSESHFKMLLNDIFEDKFIDLRKYIASRKA